MFDTYQKYRYIKNITIFSIHAVVSRGICGKLKQFADIVYRFVLTEVSKTLKILHSSPPDS